jgi:hypothetical protein
MRSSNRDAVAIAGAGRLSSDRPLPGRLSSSRSAAWAIVALALLLLAACTPTTAYRKHLASPGTECQATPDHSCPGDVLYEVRPTDAAAAADAEAPKSVHLGFVEFDDQGYLLEPALKDELMQRIESMAVQQPLLIVVYAHGWKHNAADGDTDIAAFQKLLLRVAAADHEVCKRSACARRHVVGVYLGWRGLSATLEPFKELSFWSRKSRAHRVGTDGATEVIAELAKIKSSSNALPGRSRSDETHLVLTGHSFGGALLYSATEQLLIRDSAFPTRGTLRRNVADLVVLVNPAFEAARFHAIQRKASRLAFDRTQRPILAVFTSKTDTATGVAFPLGRGLSTLFQSYTSPEQRSQNVTALGHYAPFHTHELNLEAAKRATTEPIALPALGPSLCGWQDFQSGQSDTWELGDLSFTRLPRMRVDGQRQNPYMVVSVDGGIIAGHNGIWGERFSEFLYRFVAVQSARPGRACNAPASAAEDTADD